MSQAEDPTNAAADAAAQITPMDHLEGWSQLGEHPGMLADLLALAKRYKFNVVLYQASEGLWHTFLGDMAVSEEDGIYVNLTYHHEQLQIYAKTPGIYEGAKRYLAAVLAEAGWPEGEGDDDGPSTSWWGGGLFG